MQDIQKSSAQDKRAEKKIARRHQLREFQREITEKTFKSEQKNTTPDNRRLGVQVGQEYLLMHLVQTGEVLTFPLITGIPNTKPWFLGLFSHRDRLLGLTDLAGMMGKEINDKNKLDKVLTCAPALSMHCAFRVTRIVGLVDVATMSVIAASEKEAPWITRYYMDANKIKWAEFNLEILINHPRFVNISLQ